ncbi:YncE family protein [Gordonia amarae]|nr:YncE family protein [Gordonia amarae]MCS3878230.1 DNA-binding beta-propeller fold protein YncE [Gordonia amarae]QHN16894.1 YncE family protein [Gordonia amarae]QHN21419.1 YncE family protein [Gordonia amarae]QHN30270.1 YncE family protein [Gordonia amarae]QHN39046.1 YncE family protein [Gordonia amarae]
MSLRRNRISLFTAALLCVAAPGIAQAPLAAAAPNSPVAAGWSFRVSSVPAGVGSGGELAYDNSRRSLFITDDDFVMSTKGGSDVSFDPHVVKPKVTVFSTATRRPVRSIDFTPQPWGMMPVGNAPIIPTLQVPDGISLDTKRGKLVVSNSHANGVTVVDMSARTTSARNLVSVPNMHPMGSVVDTTTGRAYVALNNASRVAVISTVTGRKIAEIGGIAWPSFVDLDAKRHRLYVGNADYLNKKTNYLAVVDTRTDKVIKRITTPSNTRPKVDPATGRIFAASFDTGKLLVIDPDSLTVSKTVATSTSPNKLAIDAQRRLVYSANLQKRTITVLDADSAKVIATVPTGAPVHTIAVDPATGAVYGTQHQSGRLTIVSVARNR